MARKKTTAPANAIDANDARMIAFDPELGPNQIAPEDGDLLTFLVGDKFRTILFKSGLPEDGQCKRCVNPNEDDGLQKTFCNYVDCFARKVGGVEHKATSDGKYYVPIEAPCKDEEPLKLADVLDVDKERQDGWERALRELEEKARGYELMAETYKQKAKQNNKTAQKLRSRMLEILMSGSENYCSETPLFDLIGEELDAVYESEK